jgi:hypothetical protein
LPEGSRRAKLPPAQSLDVGTSRHERQKKARRFTATDTGMASESRSVFVGVGSFEISSILSVDPAGPAVPLRRRSYAEALRRQKLSDGSIDLEKGKGGEGGVQLRPRRMNPRRLAAGHLGTKSRRNSIGFGLRLVDLRDS